MNHAHFKRTRLATAIASVALAGNAFGAAFALQEQSASALGNAFAGGAAATEDASAMFQNPAALAAFDKPQVVLGVHLITPSIKFKNDNSQAAAFQPLGGSGGDAGSTVPVPNLYLAVPITREFAFGLGINAPFGLITEYDDNWLGRFQGIKSDVKTLNINPALSWRVNDQFTLGAGVNWQRIDATFTSMVNYSGAIAQAAGAAAAAGQIPAAAVPGIIAATPGLESKSTVDGDDSAWGWNVGVMWNVNQWTRVGASYRSQIKYNVKGNVGFDNPTPSVPPALAPVVGLLAGAVNSTALYNGGISSDITLPELANLSIFQSFSDRWDIMADVQYTGWSKLHDLTFVRTTGGVLQSTPENFDDTWRFSAGASYKYSDAWKFRMGVAYDQTPVNDTDRTVRLPDGDRYWLAGGARWTYSPNLAFDIGATYIWSKKASIDQDAGNPAGSGVVNGHYDSNVVVVSGQMVYSF